MAIPHAKSGDLVSIDLDLSKPITELSRTLVRDEHIEIFTLGVAAGSQMQEHRAAGRLSVHCLSGEVRLHCHGKVHTLRSGQLVYLQDGEPHSVEGVSTAVLLLTLVLNRK